MENLKELIQKRKAKVAVVGLGYVGTPVAALFADAGFDVLGLDIQEEKIKKINQGINPIEGKEPGLTELVEKVVKSGKLLASSDYTKLKEIDLVTVSVETPVDDETKVPKYVALRSAIESIGKNMKRGAVVIVESTIAPRTMADIVRPILEESSGMKLNEGFFLANCPERVMPGKLLHNIRGCDRVIGAFSEESGEVVREFYTHIVQAHLDVTDPLTAEIVKTAENTYRDVQIAFANELALVCEALGANFWKVRELVNKSPERNVHYAGAGVGGHCIPKDSWLLIAPLKGKLETKIIPDARYINDSMPLHVAELLRNGLTESGKKLEGSEIAVLGYAYLPNSDDTRNSPSISLVTELQKIGAKVRIHDPYVEEYRGDLGKVVAGAEAVVVMVAHEDYLELDWEKIRKSMKGNLLVDGRNVLDKEKATSSGFVYKAVGVGD
ncbi:MAG: nucleotide sugar dehydrogenase [candidate division WWE3 bacterium CSP1-7]|uniref:Nucleotide sugar dehydrogenase n=1 Tax=candidate division WWE3 bacterium CSP1-7 TaxID=1576480 RepID=A0A0T5ZY39_UNCKA|nr:MAG: nucleotide sugar dehydrogenase [candidate division WWE3 bacterium CSP1-7]